MTRHRDATKMMELVKRLKKRTNIDRNGPKEPAMDPATLDRTTDGTGTKESPQTDGSTIEVPNPVASVATYNGPGRA